MGDHDMPDHGYARSPEAPCTQCGSDWHYTHECTDDSPLTALREALEAVESRHRQVDHHDGETVGNSIDGRHCSGCNEDWPCSAARLRAVSRLAAPSRDAGLDVERLRTALTLDWTPFWRETPIEEADGVHGMSTAFDLVAFTDAVAAEYMRLGRRP